MYKRQITICVVSRGIFSALAHVNDASMSVYLCVYVGGREKECIRVVHTELSLRLLSNRQIVSQRPDD